MTDIEKDYVAAELRWKPPAERVRIIYSDAPGLTDVVAANPGKVFAVIGPFENHMDKEDLQNALRTILRGYNVDFGSA